MKYGQLNGEELLHENGITYGNRNDKHMISPPSSPIYDNKVYNDNNFINWSNEWKQRILKNNNSKEKSIDLMKMSNPNVIPRNHKVEEALNSANEGNLEILNKLLLHL